MTRLEASGGVSWARRRFPGILSTIAKVIFVVGQVGSIGLTLDMFAMTYLVLMGLLAYPAWIISYIVSLSQSTDAGSFDVGVLDLVVVYGAMRTVVPLRSIRAALLVERESFGSKLTAVDVELENGDRVSLTLRDHEQARAVVDALGFGSGGRRIHSTFAKPTRRLLHPLLGVLAYGGGIGAALLLATVRIRQLGSIDNFGLMLAFGPIVAIAVYEVLKRLARAPEAIAGEDGVEVRRVFGTTFIPRRDIEAVERSYGKVFICRRNGERLALGGIGSDPAHLAAFARFIEERSPPEAAADDRLALYGRADLSIAEWRAQLERRLKQADYRSTASTTDEALAVLRSAQATPDQRVGAALVARVGGIPPERIRVAAEASADERVRVALEAVAEDKDDAVIEKAMKRMSR